MMRDARLGGRPGFRLAGIAEGRQRQRQNPHGGSIAGVAFRERAFDRSMHDVAADAAAAGIAHVDGAGFEPGREFLAHIAGIEIPAAHERAAERQRHFGIVGHLSRLEPQPAAAHDLAVYAILGGDLASGHELDRGAQGVADGKAKKRGQGAVFHGQGGHGKASLKYSAVTRYSPPIARYSPSPFNGCVDKAIEKHDLAERNPCREDRIPEAGGDAAIRCKGGQIVKLDHSVALVVRFTIRCSSNALIPRNSVRCVCPGKAKRPIAHWQNSKSRSS